MVESERTEIAMRHEWKLVFEDPEFFRTHVVEGDSLQIVVREIGARWSRFVHT